jgi:hypothetical protein
MEDELMVEAKLVYEAGKWTNGQTNITLYTGVEQGKQRKKSKTRVQKQRGNLAYIRIA